MEYLYDNRTLSVMLTYKCTASCSNCGTFSTPRDNTSVDIFKVYTAIDEAKDLNFNNVVFTGGEATIYWQHLILGIKYAKSKGFPVRLVTNAHWAETKKIAKKKLVELASYGLDEINFSTGDEHLKYISLDKINNAIDAAIELKIRNVLMFEVRHNSKVSLSEIQIGVNKRNVSESIKKYFKIVQSPWMPLNPGKKSYQKNSDLVNKSNVTSRTGCDSILNTYVLQGDGKIASCCGLGMRYINELHSSNTNVSNFITKAINKSEQDWIKLAIRQKGPEKILAWAAQIDPTIEWENMYSHRCQACVRMYKDEKVKKVILENLQELMPNLLFSLFIDRKVEKELSNLP